jgi:TolB-like protein/Tfp pilus assembly protein PilF
MDTPSADIALFEGFRLERRAGVLFRRDERGVFATMAIGSRALDILGVLVERPGDLVSRAEIIEAVWPGTAVEDSNLNVQVAALRRLLDDGRAEGSCIQTVSGRGYRFVAPVTRVEPAAPAHVVVAPRLSIVVLPFTNLSNDPEQQYFADGITEDLTTDLSRLVGMFVISRNTAFTYRNKPVDTKQIGRELGVRYALEGSVRRSGNQVRVSVQLIDATTDAHLWAERFDSDTVDFFALQNEITSRIGNTLSLELIGAEAARPTADPDALDYILRGRAAFAKGPARDNLAEAIGLFERALALDPQSVEAQTQLARALMSRALDRLTDSAVADIARAEGLIDQVLAASPRNISAHFAKGQLLRAQGRCEEASLEYETVIAYDRNSAKALVNIGRCRMLTGSLDQAIPPMEQAIRLSPHDPFIGTWYQAIGQVHLLQSRINEAILWLEKSRSANPGRPPVHPWLASAYALKGDTGRAAAELAEARKLGSDDRYSSIARLKAIADFGVPTVRTLFDTTFLAGLRKAGMPEE